MQWNISRDINIRLIVEVNYWQMHFSRPVIESSEEILRYKWLILSEQKSAHNVIPNKCYLSLLTLI